MQTKRFGITQQVVILGSVLLLSTCTGPELTTGPTAQPEQFIENPPEAAAVAVRLNALKTELQTSLQPPVIATIEQALRTYSVARPVSEVTPGLSRRANGHSEDSVLFAMAVEALTRGSMKTALYCLIGAAMLKPDNPDYLSKTGFALAYLGRDSAAKELLLYARLQDSAMHEVHATLGSIYEREGDRPRAIFEMHRALELFPNNPYYLVQLSSLYFASGERAAAWSVFTQARHFAPGLAEVKEMALAFRDVDTTMLGNPGGLPGISELMDLAGNPGGPEKNAVYILDSITELYTNVLSSQAQTIGAHIGVGGTQYIIEQDFLAACTSCGTCRTAFSKAASLQTNDVVKTSIIYRDFLTLFSYEALGILRRNPHAVDYTYASKFAFSVMASIEELISGLIPESADLISEWQGEAIRSCSDEDPGTVTPGLPGEEDNLDIGVCIVVVCININNRKVSLQGNIFFVATNLELDMDKKTVALGLGVTCNGWATARIDVATDGEVALNLGTQMSIGPSVSKSIPLFTLWSGTLASAGSL